MASFRKALEALERKREEEEETPSFRKALENIEPRTSTRADVRRRDREGVTNQVPLRRALSQLALTTADLLPEDKFGVVRSIGEFGQEQERQANIEEGLMRDTEDSISAPPTTGVIETIGQTARNIPESYEQSALGLSRVIASVSDQVLGTDLEEGLAQTMRDIAPQQPRPEGFVAEMAGGITQVIGDLPKYAHPGLVVSDAVQAGFNQSRERGDGFYESAVNASGKGLLQALTLKVFRPIEKVTGKESRSLLRAGNAEGLDEAVNATGGRVLDAATSEKVDLPEVQEVGELFLKSYGMGFGAGSLMRATFNKMTPNEYEAQAIKFREAKIEDLDTPEGITFSDFHDRTIGSIGGNDFGSILGSLNFFRETFKNGKDLTIELSNAPSPAKGGFTESEGKITLYVQNLKNYSPKEVIGTLFHEGVGHPYAKELMGEEGFEQFRKEVFENHGDWLDSMVRREARDVTLRDGQVIKGRQISREDAFQEYFPYWLERNWEKGGTAMSVFKAKALQKLSQITETPRDNTEVLMQQALRDWKHQAMGEGKFDSTQTRERRSLDIGRFEPMPEDVVEDMDRRVTESPWAKGAPVIDGNFQDDYGGQTQSRMLAQIGHLRESAKKLRRANVDLIEAFEGDFDGYLNQEYDRVENFIQEDSTRLERPLNPIELERLDDGGAHSRLLDRAGRVKTRERFILEEKARRGTLSPVETEQLIEDAYKQAETIGGIGGREWRDESEQSQVGIVATDLASALQYNDYPQTFTRQGLSEWLSQKIRNKQLEYQSYKNEQNFLTTETERIANIIRGRQQYKQQFQTGKPVVVRGWRGDTVGGVNELDFRFAGDATGAQSAKMGFFMSGDRDNAEVYMREAKAPVPPLEEWIDRPMELVELYGNVDGINGPIYSVFDRMEFTEDLDVKNKYDQKELLQEMLRVNPDKFYNFLADEVENTPDMYDIKDTWEDFIENPEGGDLRQVYTRFENPYVVDYDGSEYREVKYATHMKNARDGGHDGVIFLDSADPRPGNIFAVFNTDQMRVARPDAKDDNGKLIPLEERFQDPEGIDLRYSLHEGPEPKKTGKAYRALRYINGRLYPAMVGDRPIPFGAWLNAEYGPPNSYKKGGKRTEVKGFDDIPEDADNLWVKSAQGGEFAFRPGWHLGDVPSAKQFVTKDQKWPSNMLWVEVEYDNTNDYDQDPLFADQKTGNKLKKNLIRSLPQDGSYKYQTNPDPRSMAWVISDKARHIRVVPDAEVKALVDGYNSTRSGEAESAYFFERQDGSEIDERTAERITNELTALGPNPDGVRKKRRGEIQETTAAVRVPGKGADLVGGKVVVREGTPVKERYSLDLKNSDVFEPVGEPDQSVPLLTRLGRSWWGTDFAISSMGGDLAKDALNARAIQRGVAGAIDQVLNYSGVRLDESGTPIANPNVKAVNDIIANPNFEDTVAYLQYKQDQIALQNSNELFERLSNEETAIATDLALAESILLHRQSNSEIRSILTDIKNKQSEIERINKNIKEPNRKDVAELKKKRGELREEQKNLQNFLTVKQSTKLATRIAKNEARLEDLNGRLEDMTSDTIEDNIELLRLEAMDIKKRIKGEMNRHTKEFISLSDDLIRYNEEMARLAVRNQVGLQENIEGEWNDLSARVAGALQERRRVAADLRGQGKDVAGNTIKAAEELTEVRQELAYLRLRSKDNPRVLERIAETEQKIADLRAELEAGQPTSQNIRDLAKVQRQIARLDNAIAREKRLSESEADRAQFKQDQEVIKSKYRDEMSQEIKGLVNPYSKQEKRDAYRLSVKLRKQLSDVRKRRGRTERLIRAGKSGLVGEDMRKVLEKYKDSGDPELLKDIQAMNENTMQLLLDSGVITEEEADNWDVENYFTASRHSPLFKEAMADVFKARKGGSDKKFQDPSILRGIQAKIIQLAMDTIAKRRMTELMVSLGAASQPQTTPFERGTSQDTYLDENGNELHVQILDVPMYDAMMKTSEAYALPIVSTARNVVRGGITNVPDFSLRQFIADSITTGLLRKEMIPVIDSVIGLWKASFDPKLVREYKTAGGEMGYNYDLQADSEIQRTGTLGIKYGGDRARRANLKNNPLFKWTVDLYQDILSKGELANRLRLYEKVRNQTGSRAEGVFAGRTLGADFGRRAEGALPKALNAAVPFFNAGWQATHSLAEHLKRDPITPLVRSMLFTSAYMGIRALNYAMFDEEEWEDMNKAITAQEKVKFFHFYTRGEDGKPVRWRIPRDRNLGAITAISEIWLDNLQGRDKQDMAKVIAAAAMQQVSTDVVPQFIKPPIEYATGYDMFRGRHYVPPGRKGLPEEEYNEYTSELMKRIGRETGLSPQRVEQLWKGYTGTLGTLALAGTDKVSALMGWSPQRVDPRRVGPVSSDLLRMAERVEGDTDKMVGEYYELVKKIQDADASYRRALNSGDLEAIDRIERKYSAELERAPLVRDMTKEENNLMSYYSNAIREIQTDPDMSAREKLDEIIQLNRERNAYVRENVPELRLDQAR